MYTKSVWVDEVLDGAVTYEIDGVGGKTIDLETTVTTPGTSVTAARMNNIETGIEKAIENPMTTQGDTIYGGASGLPTRLAKGTAGQVLQMNSGATAPEWGAVPARMITGQYIGNGSASQTINIGVTPKAVYVSQSGIGGDGHSASSNITAGLAVTGYPADYGTGYELVLIVSNGFTIY
jgi:hypothetical protein